MGSYDAEYKKGLKRGIEGKEAAESPLDKLNFFRSDQEREAREKGFEAGQKELELRHRGLHN